METTSAIPAITQSEQPEMLARNVSLEDYMEHYAALGAEWVEGDVIKMPPIGLRHEEVRDYLRLLFQTYFSFKPIGRVLGEPFVMRLPTFPKRRREPDLMIVLKSNPHELQETSMTGPADICIEIVSPATVSIDHGDKFSEYEQGGVPEYWIVDPIRSECRFYRLNEEGIYLPIAVDAQGHYTTPALPGLVLSVPVLWQETLPNPIDVVESVREMLKDKD